MRQGQRSQPLETGRETGRERQEPGRTWTGAGLLKKSSGIMGGATGIMLQNRGASFSLDPSHPNALAPGARPLHTLMPGMLLRDGAAIAALGAIFAITFERLGAMALNTPI